MFRLSSKATTVCLLLLIFVLLVSAVAEAANVKLKNKTNQAIVLTCSGQTIQIPAKGTVSVANTWMSCPAVQTKIQSGSLVVIP
jgi:biopolymer transport protein ExbD